MPIQLYGYVKGSDADHPSPLSEVTISASTSELRRAAEFLMHAAALLEQHGEGFGHEHLSDFDRGVSANADLIVGGPVRASEG